MIEMMYLMIYGTNSRKNDFKGRCIVAFVDFLGFSNEIMNNWISNEDNPLDRLRSFVRNINKSLTRQTREFDRLQEMQKECKQMKAKIKNVPLLNILHEDKNELTLADLGISRIKS